MRACASVGLMIICSLGLLGGALACALVVRTPEAVEGEDAPGGVREVAGWLVVAHLFAFIMAADYALTSSDFKTVLMEAFARDSR